MIAIAMGHALDESVVPVNSKKPEMKSVAQSELKASKTWKDYISVHAEIAKIAAGRPKRDARDHFKPMDKKISARLRKLNDQSSGLRTPLKELFGPDAALGADLASLLERKIENVEDMLRPKPGRRPQPDFAAEAAEGFSSLQRDFRIVEAFKRLKLRDSLIDDIRDNLPKAISFQRSALQSLILKDSTRTSIPIRPTGLSPASSPDTDTLSLDAMEAELIRMEIQWAAWYDEDVKNGSKPPRKTPDQATLDHSETWIRYVDMHRAIAAEKSDSGLGRVRDGIRKLKPALDTLFRDDSLAGDLIAWPEALIRSRQSALGPKAKPLPDSLAWGAIWETYETSKTRFRIAKAFRDKELEHPLIRTMASRLPIEIGNLKGELKSRESDGKPDHAGQSAEVNAFVKSSEAEFAAWKKKPR